MPPEALSSRDELSERGADVPLGYLDACPRRPRSVEEHEAPAAEEVRDLLITLLGQLGRPD